VSLQKCSAKIGRAFRQENLSVCGGSRPEERNRDCRHIEHIPHTARDYLKSARYKLDCVTSAQAANKAVQIGLFVL
jgi:hypothetical protein